MLNSTSLYDQNTFYKAFMRDIGTCRQELIIESPFITEKRVNMLLPELAQCHLSVATRVPSKNGMDAPMSNTGPIAWQPPPTIE